MSTKNIDQEPKIFHFDVEEKQKILIKLKECQEMSDQESAHEIADDIWCKLLTMIGFEDIVKEYEKIDKWYA